MKLLDKARGLLGIKKVEDALTKVEVGTAVRTMVGGLGLLLSTTGCAKASPPSISPDAQAQASASAEVGPEDDNGTAEANAVAQGGTTEVQADPTESQTRESKLGVVQFRLMQARGIPTEENIGLTEFVKRLKNDNLFDEIEHKELLDRFALFVAEGYQEEERKKWKAAVKSALESEEVGGDIRVLYRDLEEMRNYFGQFTTEGQDEFVDAVWTYADREHPNRPGENPDDDMFYNYRLKVFSVWETIPNPDALEALGWDSDYMGNQLLLRVDLGDIWNYPGHMARIYDPTQKRNIEFKILPGRMYDDGSGPKHSTNLDLENKKYVSAFVSQYPAGGPQVGVPSEEPSEEDGKPKKARPFIFGKYNFAAMEPAGDESDEEHPMTAQTISLGAGVQLGDPEKINGALTGSADVRIVGGRPDEKTDAPGKMRATAWGTTLGAELHLPLAEWVELLARGEVILLLSGKDPITNRPRIGGGVGTGAGVNFWMGKHKRFGLNVTGGYRYIVNPTDHGHNLGEYTLDRPLIPTHDFYVGGGVLFRFGKSEENK